MRVSLALSGLVLALGCGSGGGGGGGGAGFTATVNGEAWAAEPVGVTALGGGVPGGIVVTGSQTAGNLVTSLTLNLHAITGPGTYALGVGLDWDPLKFLLRLSAMAISSLQQHSGLSHLRLLRAAVTIKRMPSGR